jgi:hypothetical protein
MTRFALGSLVRAAIAVSAAIGGAACGMSVDGVDGGRDVVDAISAPDISDIPDVPSVDALATCTINGSRPCPRGEYCGDGDLTGGAYDGSCWCQEGMSSGQCTGIACQPPTMTPPPDGGVVYQCDLASVFGAVTTIPPTETWCCMWHTVWGATAPGAAVQCVRIEQCAPIPCIPGYTESCPWGYTCSAATGTCTP